MAEASACYGKAALAAETAGEAALKLCEPTPEKLLEAAGEAALKFCMAATPETLREAAEAAEEAMFQYVANAREKYLL